MPPVMSIWREPNSELRSWIESRAPVSPQRLVSCSRTETLPPFVITLQNWMSKGTQAWKSEMGSES